MAPVTGRTKKFNSTNLWLRGFEVAYILTSEKLHTALFYCQWHLEFPIEQNAIYMRIARRGMARAINSKSVLEVKEDLIPNEQLYDATQGLCINLDFVLGVSKEQENRRIIHLDIDGVIEGIGVSRQAASRLAAAFVEHQRRKARSLAAGRRLLSPNSKHLDDGPSALE